MYRNWHTHEIKEILRTLAVNPKKGLSSEEVFVRQQKFGRNILIYKKPISPFFIFLNQFNNYLVFILLFSTVVSFVLGHIFDSLFVLGIIIINALVGFFQEVKASQALEALRKMIRFKSRVLRNGEEKEVDSEDLVVGDVIFLKAGDKVMADARLISQKNLKVNESFLTGESLPVEKNEKKFLQKDTLISERVNMLFSGTEIEAGEAQAVVVAVGEKTEFGNIVKSLGETEEPPTPLQKKIATLSWQLSIFIFIIMGVILVLGLIRGETLANIVLAALALAVSSIPEGLPVAISVVLVLAMRRTLKNKGLIKKLVAAESLGSVSVICTDKTGTLTEGEMKVSKIITSDSEFLSDGKRFINSLGNNQESSSLKVLLIATLTNDAFIENPKDNFSDWIVRGYFTDRALLLAGIQAGIDKIKEEKRFPLIERLSFDSDIKMAATLREDLQKKKKLLFIVGAPEKVVKKSKWLYVDGKMGSLGEKRFKEISLKLEKLTLAGLRVVACALKEIDEDQFNLYKKEGIKTLIKELSLVGFVALKDPIRKDVKEAVNNILKAGIRPIIISGDHPLTVKRVAQEIGLKISQRQIIEGEALEKMNETDLARVINKIKIFARAIPEHKLKIIKALHRNKEVVAMFGDGVNDVTALKGADVGVAVEAGTDVAKETADIILLNNSFSVIAKAIEQGRIAFKNIQKIFIFLLADDFAEVVLFLLSLFLNLPLPLLPTQILWINLIVDSFPALALATEEEREGIMKEKPRNPNAPFLDFSLKKWIFSVFLFNSLLVFFLYFFLLKLLGEKEIEKIRTILIVFSTFNSLTFIFSVKNFKKTIFSANLLENKYITLSVILGLILIILSIYHPWLNIILRTIPLKMKDLLFVFFLSVLELFVYEFFKKVFLIGWLSKNNNNKKI